MAQKLANTLGWPRGFPRDAISRRRARGMVGRDAVVVTVFCDDNKKYLRTALTNEEPVKPEYKTPEIELLSVGTVGRACELCPLRVVAHSERGPVTSTDIVRAPQPCHSERSLRSKENPSSIEPPGGIPRASSAL
jgi:hypothetical protein